MGISTPAVLCVDDEVNILNALKRLLRKEPYRLLTAGSAKEGLKLISEEHPQVVICDQRMPEMDGATFLRQVKETYPDVIRITLTGFTDVDSIREAVNQGYIFKFLLKPWNDENLILEIRQALRQYELSAANRELNQKVVAQNRELKHLNDHLETLVKQRTEEIVIRNQALELSQAILSDLPIPIIGVDVEGMIVMTNNAVDDFFEGAVQFGVGRMLGDYFPPNVIRSVQRVLSEDSFCSIEIWQLKNVRFKVQSSPLRGKFKGRGIILTFHSAEPAEQANGLKFQEGAQQ